MATWVCPACAALGRGDVNAGTPIPPHQNPADWIETHSPLALHARLGGGHYTVFPDEFCWPERAWYVRHGADDIVGRFGSTEDAKAAAKADAIARYGDATLGALDPCWGQHENVTRG